MSSYLGYFYLWQLILVFGIPFTFWLASIFIDTFKTKDSIKLVKDDEKKETKVTERMIPLKRRHLILLKKNNSWVINHIQDETKTKITFIFDSIRRPERQLLIRGPLYSVTEADKMIRKAIQEKSNVDVYDMGIDIEIIDKFIGKEVDIVRDIQGISGTNIMIRSEVDPLTGPIGRILITGTCKEISKAIPLVEEKLKNFDESKVIKKFGQSEKVVLLPELRLLDLIVIGQEIHMHVRMSSIDNPSHFYVQIDSLQDIESEKLNTEMNEFYGNSANLKMLGMYDIKKGNIVAVKREDENWYRCEVLEVHDDSCLLMYVDIGYEGTAKRTDIYELPQFFLKYIVQAYECVLSNVGEPLGGWTDKAIAKFKELCTVKPSEKLCMHIRNTKIVLRAKASIRQNIYVVDLYKGDLNIGSKLRKEGYAVIDNTMSNYYKKVPKEDEAKLKEILEAFRMYKEMNEDIDEEFREQLQFEDFESDDDFDSGDHDNLEGLLKSLKNDTNISKDNVLNNVITTNKQVETPMKNSNELSD